MENPMRATLFVSLLLTACAASAPANDPDGVESSEDALATYRVKASVSPSPVQPGSTAELAIRVLGANDVPVTAFDDLHTQKMHVVAVSSDLQDFMHVHPVLGNDGTLTVGVPISRAQPYRFFFEYDPVGPAGEQTSRATLRPVGATTVAPGLAAGAAFAGSAAVATVVDGTKIELQPLAHGMIMSGAPSTLRVALTTTAGAPVTDLVDWLGMPGHAIVLSEDTSTFIHAHAMRPGSGGHGGSSSGGHGGSSSSGGHGGHGGSTPSAAPSNVLDIDVNFPQPGFYKMFVQVKRGENIVTAPFVLRATTM